MKERLDATIIPTQRTIESLQAEFVALRSEEKEGGMDCAAAYAKRLRTDADMYHLGASPFDSLAPPVRERCESKAAFL